MSYLIPPPPLPVVPVAGSTGYFPVHRIYCVGRNYAAHAREMGSDPDREPPFFFCKPADAVLPIAGDGTTLLPYPSATKNFQHEVELVLAIGKSGRNISANAAINYVWGYALGLDMTRRDIQFALRDKGRPWDMGKAFDFSAPISAIYPISQVSDIESRKIWLSVNGQMRQEGKTADMIWSVAEIISNLSIYVELKPGDLIFTGTPEGVGPVQPGDLIDGGLVGLCEFSLRVAP